ncbi:MAG: hypothetical protein JW388_1542 [Nitrospira sp.]|nr:hypothetical protein [Nitrospira sp.]
MQQVAHAPLRSERHPYDRATGRGLLRIPGHIAGHRVHHIARPVRPVRLPHAHKATACDHLQLRAGCRQLEPVAVIPEPTPSTPTR